MPYWDNGHMNNDWGIAMMLGMLGFWVLVTVAVAVAVVRIVRSTKTHSVAPTDPTAAPASIGGTGSAVQILAERLARGEIDPEDYKARREVLRTRR
jgi:putative membrane protein